MVSGWWIQAGCGGTVPLTCFQLGSSRCRSPGACFRVLDVVGRGMSSEQFESRGGVPVGERSDNRRAMPMDRPYMRHWRDTQSAVVHLDVTDIHPSNTGNQYEHPHVSVE